MHHLLNDEISIIKYIMKYLTIYLVTLFVIVNNGYFCIDNDQTPLLSTSDIILEIPVDKESVSKLKPDLSIDNVFDDNHNKYYEEMEKLGQLTITKMNDDNSSSFEYDPEYEVNPEYKMKKKIATAKGLKIKDIRKIWQNAFEKINEKILCDNWENYDFSDLNTKFLKIMPLFETRKLLQKRFVYSIDKCEFSPSDLDIYKKITQRVGMERFFIFNDKQYCFNTIFFFKIMSWCKRKAQYCEEKEKQFFKAVDKMKIDYSILQKQYNVTEDIKTYETFFYKQTDCCKKNREELETYLNFINEIIIKDSQQYSSCKICDYAQILNESCAMQINTKLMYANFKMRSKKYKKICIEDFNI